MTKPDIVTPGPDPLASDADANALRHQTGNFIGTAWARMERGKALSIMLGQLWRRERAQGAAGDHGGDGVGGSASGGRWATPMGAHGSGAAPASDQRLLARKEVAEPVGLGVIAVIT